jgi:thiamine-phosphate pyrophosphorylase
MLVTERRLADDEDALVEAAAAAVEGGVNAVQVREKDLDTEALAALAARLRAAIGGRALLIVNGDAPAAAEAGADGLHLPEDAPFQRPPGLRLVGRSVHSAEAAALAGREGADYVIAGPVYETASHPGVAPAGVRLVSAVAAAVSVPVLAIGGVTAERVAELRAAGADGVAVISAVLGSESPRAAASRLREALAAVPAGER